MTQSCYLDEAVASACCLACAEPGGHFVSRQASYLLGPAVCQVPLQVMGFHW